MAKCATEYMYLQLRVQYLQGLVLMSSRYATCDAERGFWRGKLHHGSTSRKDSTSPQRAGV